MAPEETMQRRCSCFCHGFAIALAMRPLGHIALAYSMGGARKWTDVRGEARR